MHTRTGCCRLSSTRSLLAVLAMLLKEKPAQRAFLFLLIIRLTAYWRQNYQRDEGGSGVLMVHENIS